MVDTAGHAAADMAGAGVTEGARTGIVNSLMTGVEAVGTFAAAHPYPTALMTTAVAGALSPDEMDLQENQWKREDKLRRERIMNMEGRADLNLGHRPAVRQSQRIAPGVAPGQAQSLGQRVAQGAV